MWDLCLWRNDFLKIWVTLDAQKIPLGKQRGKQIGLSVILAAQALSTGLEI